MNKSKLLIIGPCLTMGGMERASSTLANAIVSESVAVSFLTILKKPHFFELNKAIRLFEPNGFNSTKISFLKTLFFIRKSVKQTRPDCVLVFGKFYAALTCLALFGTSTRVVISERSSPFYKWPFSQRLVQDIAFFCKQPHACIAQTEQAAQVQRNYFRNEVVVIPNAVRQVTLYPETQRELIVLGIGRLGEYIKGMDLLIEAFGGISNPNWKLHLAGTTQGGEHLIARVKELKIEDRVVFLGAVKDLDSLFAKASIFVIPSRSEGFPNALIEAMAAGLACVSFDFDSGPREIITQGTDGLLVEKEKVDLLAQNIQLLQEDERYRNLLGQNAMGVRTRLAEDKIADSFLKVCLK